MVSGCCEFGRLGPADEGIVGAEISDDSGILGRLNLFCEANSFG